MSHDPSPYQFIAPAQKIRISSRHTVLESSQKWLLSASEKHLSRAGVGKLLQGQKVNMLGLGAHEVSATAIQPCHNAKQSLTLCK